MMGIRKKPCFLRVSRGGRQGVLHPICTPKCKIASVNRGQILANLLKLMVPPDRIELSTSPLPMARSTPELRRHIFRASNYRSIASLDQSSGATARTMA